MQRHSKTNKTAYIFEWLGTLHSAIASEQARRIPKDERRLLTNLDLSTAWSLTRWFDQELTCFRSYAAIAEDCGCSSTSARGSVGRLLTAGFLSIPMNKKNIGGGTGGRPAQTYRATFPPGFCNQTFTNDDDFSTSRLAETGQNPSGVCATTVGGVSATTVAGVFATTVAPIHGNNSLENSWENTPPTPRRAGGADTPDRHDGFTEKQDAQGEVVPFPSRRSPVANPEDRIDLPKRPDRKSRRTLAGPLFPGCNTLNDEAAIFWNEYPDPVALGDVEREWEKARKVATFEQIMAGLEAYIRRTDNPRDAGFRATPANWLRGKRWIDPERKNHRGIETTTDRLCRVFGTGTDGNAAIDGPRKAPAITFEDLEGRGR